jgi:2-amino-4-hydroxy-6-hydroxymethyldihydropteridine diphosphokinase/dihydropteroate synthase
LNSCILAIGTNSGDRLSNVETSISLISKKIAYTNIKQSSVIETSALLLPNSPNDWNLLFLNLAILIQTDLSFLQIFQVIKEIENDMGRDFSAPRWSPRIIDIDIITYNNLVYSSNNLEIPHAQMHKRRFVMKPVCELAASNVHPVFKKTFKQLLDELMNS